MNRRTLNLSLAAWAAAATPVFAEESPVPELEPTVVTATRTATPLRQVGSSVSVITAEDIARRQVYTAADALRTVPGLDVIQSGGLGRQTSVFLRGANANQTLVLIDGVEMNDPSSPNNLFDFADLMADNIERIEILRGAQSSVYGSDAIGGVINIITKKGAGRPELSLTGEGGSYDTFKVGGSVAGGSDPVDYSLSASRLETGGFSAADERWGNRERDGYRNTTVSSRLGLKALDNLDFGWTLRFSEGETRLDADFPRPHDDPNYFSRAEKLNTRGFAHLELFDGLWEQTLGLAYSRTDRTAFDKPDPANPYAFPSQYLGEKVKVDWQNNLRLHETNTLSFGVEDEEDRLSSDSDPVGAKSSNTQGYFLQDQISLWNRWFTTAGVRYDEHNRVGGKVTWRVTQALAFDETGTRLKGSYGTGFRAPSLVELYDRYTGNPDLRPEESTNWDIGLEQSLLEGRVQLGATYFNNDFDDLIQYVQTGQFMGYMKNINQAMAEGVETYVQVEPVADLTLRGNYTYTHTEDESTGSRLLRRPTHKASFDAHYRFLENADANLNILMVGDKADVGGAQVPGYVVVNLATGYRIHRNVRLFARVDNLFDQPYQEIYGYGTSRIAGYGGITLSY
jgi:vitamin B12 transporter